MFRTMLAATALSLIAMSATPSFAEENRMPRTINLNGHGEVRMAPDMAVVNAGVLSQALTAGEALAANAAAMNSVMAALKEAGIEAKDIQTSNFAVMPRYDYNNDGRSPRLAGYDVSNTVTVTVRKIEGLGAVLDKLVSAGSNQINGIQFAVDKPDAALDEARKLAVTDARKKAELYAGAGGVELGPILSISEGTSYSPPIPMAWGKMMQADAMAAPTPIAAGEQTLSIDVSITWEIK